MLYANLTLWQAISRYIVRNDLLCLRTRTSPQAEKVKTLDGCRWERNSKAGRWEQIVEKFTARAWRCQTGSCGLCNQSEMGIVTLGSGLRPLQHSTIVGAHSIPSFQTLTSGALD